MPREQDRAYLETIPDDEPVFIVRAQDRFANEIANAWMDTAIEGGANEQKVIDVSRNVQIPMLEWRIKNRSKIKIPD